MRKQLLILFLLVFISISPVHAITFSGVRMGNPDTTTLTGNKAVDMANIGGLTFMKDYTVSDANTLLDATEQNFTQTNGSPVAGYLVSRSPAIASTKFTTSGDMTIVTTSNARRQTEGYMNESGFSLARGELIEGSATNYVLDSDFSRGLATDNWFSNFGTVTDIPSTILPVVKSRLITHTFTSEIARYNTAYTGVTPNDSFDASGGAVKLTVSFIARGDLSNLLTAPGSNMWIAIDGQTNAGAYTETIASRNILLATPDGLHPTTWKKFYFTSTASNVATKKVVLRFIYAPGVDGTRFTTGDTFSFEVQQVQIEKQSFPTSYIPTTTAAVTRAAEPLTYPMAGNINSLENISIVMRYRPVSLPTEIISPYLFRLVNGSYRIELRYSSVPANNQLVAQAVTPSGTYTATSSALASWTRYAEHIVIATFSKTADGLGNKISIYDNGVLVGSLTNYDSQTITGSTFSIMESNNAILMDAEVYQKALTQAEVTKIQTILTTEN